MNFVNKWLKKIYQEKNILFTDEAIIDMGCYYIHDSIRLSDDNKKKLKKGG